MRGESQNPHETLVIININKPMFCHSRQCFNCLFFWLTAILKKRKESKKEKDKICYPNNIYYEITRKLSIITPSSVTMPNPA